MKKNCSNCCAEIDDPMWPDGNGDVLCQECWESHCSTEWWKRIEESWIEIEDDEDLCDRGGDCRLCGRENCQDRESIYDAKDVLGIF